MRGTVSICYQPSLKLLTVARARKGTKLLFRAYQKPSCGLLSALASAAQNIGFSDCTSLIIGYQTGKFVGHKDLPFSFHLNLSSLYA